MSTTLVLLALIASCAYIGSAFIIFLPVSSFIYPTMHFVSTFETYLSNVLCCAAFSLYVLTGMHLINMKRKSSAQVNYGEFKLLVSSALGFAYEMVMIFIFHFVLPYIHVPVEVAAFILTMWAFQPGFNGLMLIIVNRSFRERFIAWKQIPKIVSVVQVSLRAAKSTP
ncbi:hypothetical protein L596_020507 [Steinernema carpocapsae]|uniref:7TM GPCR serpentine receptor class x (Srx) domain-containing protein n=1 Tax=Steinernema carpocapsae TaxID=34508 RepID=A0A4U5MTR3_STECR|nr:hypothetical protein L596_020507 [Steinernema carpocapsae]